MKTSDMPVIDLAGSPRERGRRYGETAREEIAETLHRWRNALGSTRPDALRAMSFDPDDYLDSFLSGAGFLSSIKRWAPTLLDEVEGIAEGARQDSRAILGLQLFDEEWEFGLRCGLARPTMRCTSFGLVDTLDEPDMAGQNMDVPAWVDGCQVLLRIPGEGNLPGALVFSLAGVVALNGMNSAPLGITCNSLSQLRSARTGLPVSFIVRSVLACRTMDEAEDFLTSVDHASAQNYTLSAPGDIRCFECSATQVVRYRPESVPSRLFHTNHPFVNADWDNTSAAERMDANSKARLDSIRDRLGTCGRRVTLDDAKSALAAHDDADNPVSCRRDEADIRGMLNYTAGSSIYEFSADPKLHLASGPPCETDYKIFTLP